MAGVVSRFGDPTCWMGNAQLPELRFMPCCATRIFGSDGNPDCWREELGTSFQRCCLGLEVDDTELEQQSKLTLLTAQQNFTAAIIALAELIHLLDLERHTLGSRPLRATEVTLLTELNGLARQWRAEHLKELGIELPRVLAAYAEFLSSSASHATARAVGSPIASPRIAVLISCTPDSAGNDICQAGAALWQCYAKRHGYHFIFDTFPYPAFPKKFRFHGPNVGLDALDADFEAEAVDFLFQEPLALEAGGDGTTFKYWQRWYAARRHLPAYDLLLVVDPDTAVFPSCFSVGLPTALGLPADVDAWPGVIARDPRDGEDVNGGVFAFTTRSPWGLLYLDLMLARSRWPVDVAGGSGWCHSRQGAEVETLLEVIALAHHSSAGGVSAPGVALDYTSECMASALPQVAMNGGQEPVCGCVWSSYVNCWHKNVRRLLGEPGHRRAVPGVLLVDPTVVDINYRPWSNEPRYRDIFLNSTSLPPIAHAAFLWHYVGIPRKHPRAASEAKHLLRDFGLSGLNDVVDCPRLERRFAGAAVKHSNDGTGSTGSGPAHEERGGPSGGPLPACGLAGSPRACPFKDSTLMPQQWGC